MKIYKNTANQNTIVLNHRTKFNVSVNFVMMIKGEINYTTFIMIDGSQQVVAHTLKYFEPFLESHGFQRIHKSSIINPTFIHKYCPKSNVVTMKNGMSMKVSRRKKSDFFLAIQSQISSSLTAIFLFFVYFHFLLNYQ